MNWRTEDCGLTSDIRLPTSDFCLLTSGFRLSGGEQFIGESRNIGALAGVLDGDAQNTPNFVQVQKRILIQVAGLGDLGGLEFECNVSVS